jgi:hypothetical protein
MVNQEPLNYSLFMQIPQSTQSLKTGHSLVSRWLFTPFLLLFLFLGFHPAVWSQPLNWQFEDVLTDLQESGANPSLTSDALGNLHLAYWHQLEDKLIYGFRNAGSGTWSFSYPDSLTFGGYQSAIKVGPDGFPHIAYFENRTGISYLKYTRFDGSSWQTENVLPDSALGDYGPNLMWLEYLQPSIDLDFQSNGLPMISYFEGNIFFSTSCVYTVPFFLYRKYDLSLRLVLKDMAGDWNLQEFDFIIPDDPICLPGGDRFGEFCRILPGNDNNFHIFTNSFHNHQLLMFSSSPTDITDWNKTRLDTSFTYFEIGIQKRFLDAFEYIDVAAGSDSLIHLVYGLSNMYGFGQATSGDPLAPLKNTFYYMAVNPDSAGNPLYKPYVHDFNPPTNSSDGFSRDGIYRTYLSIAAQGEDSVFISYYVPDQSELILSWSADRGQSWTNDTIATLFTNTRTQTIFQNDMIRVLAYDSDRDQSIMFSRLVSDSVWTIEYPTVTENRANYLCSAIHRNSPGNDDVYVVFDESAGEQLFFGERKAGTWAIQPLDSAGKNPRNICMTLSDNADPVIAYVHSEGDLFKAATRTSGVWQFDTISTGVKVRDMSMGFLNDTVHLLYYNLSSASLDYARSKKGSGIWEIAIIDSSSQIIGRYPNLVIDGTGGLHASYIDSYNGIVRYAHRPAGGGWSNEAVTDTFEFDPSFNSIAIGTDGRPSIAFRNGGTNTMLLAERNGAGVWNKTLIAGDPTNFVGNPLRLIVDEADNPWVLYNYFSNVEEIRLVRRDAGMNWNPVTVSGNSARIAGVFDFHLVDRDFYIIGKKNVLHKNGLGLLYAADGVATDVGQPISEIEPTLSISPNPSAGTANIQFSNPVFQQISLKLFDLAGREVHSWIAYPMEAGQHSVHFDRTDLPAGMYLCRLETPGGVISKKLILLKE